MPGVSTILPCEQSNQPRVLIVDDDRTLMRAFARALDLCVSEVIIDTADSDSGALNLINSQEYAAIIMNAKMRGMDGLAQLFEIRKRCSEIPVLIVNGSGENMSMIEVRLGAHDFIQKPISQEFLLASLRRAIDIPELSRCAKDQAPPGWLVKPCRQMEKAVYQIKEVAPTALTVLIQGETGTGKEVAARAIHRLSGRYKGPFVPVDCGAIPDTLAESELLGYEKGAFTGALQRKKGQFTLAEGGSLFLDEIANLPLGTQGKLLRVLQERRFQPLGGEQPVRVDVRVIAASNVSLGQEVRDGRFRSDVYYRLNEFVINLPPLRERDDIVQLANDFLAEACMEFSRASFGIRSVIRRAALEASEIIDAEHLCFLQPDSSFPTVSMKQIAPPSASLKQVADAAVSIAEQEAIRRALKATKGNKSEAARLLRTDYKTLHVKMKQYIISGTTFRAS